MGLSYKQKITEAQIPKNWLLKNPDLGGGVCVGYILPNPDQGGGACVGNI